MTQIAARTILSDALDVFIPVLEDILGGNVLRIRRFFKTRDSALRG